MRFFNHERARKAAVADTLGMHPCAVVRRKKKPVLLGTVTASETGFPSASPACIGMHSLAQVERLQTLETNTSFPSKLPRLDAFQCFSTRSASCCQHVDKQCLSVCLYVRMSTETDFDITFVSVQFQSKL